MNSQPPPGAFDYLLDLKRPAPVGPRPPVRKVTAPRSVTPPPPPPERGGGGNDPPRLRIEIEIVHREAPPARPTSSWTLPAVLIWVAIAIIIGLAMVPAAKAGENWRTYQQGWETRIDGTAPDGSQWRGRQYKQGFTTFTDMNGPDGRAVHCRTIKTGWQTRTECN